MVKKNSECYLCKSKDFKKLLNSTRDLKGVYPIICNKCNLVTLNSFTHIKENHYENSGIHGKNKLSISDWIKLAKKDDERRYNYLNKFIKGKKVLDFGCGAGGFLAMSKKIAKYVAGVEPEIRVQKYWDSKINIQPEIEKFNQKFDLITCFHVIEHVMEPINTIKILKKFLNKNGTLIIEVPNHEDALLSLYNSKSFINSYYWSQHLYVFNEKTLKQLIKKTGFKNINIKQIQRYPLSNHLYWLSKGLPAGQVHWSFLNDTVIEQKYSQQLASQSKCDTILALCK